MKISISTYYLLFLILLFWIIPNDLNLFSDQQTNYKSVFFGCFSPQRDTLVVVLDSTTLQTLNRVQMTGSVVQAVKTKTETKAKKTKIDKKPNTNLVKLKNIPSDRLKFVQRFAQTAIDEQKKFNIPASIILAQSILESNAGKSKKAINDNNYFGVKYWNRNKIPSGLNKFVIGYSESHNDCCKTGNCKKPDRWVCYDRPWASFRHHSLILLRPCYKSQQNGSDYQKWARSLERGGYCKGCNDYAEQLINLIQLYGLDQFDKLASA